MVGTYLAMALDAATLAILLGSAALALRKSVPSALLLAVLAWNEGSQLLTDLLM